MTTIAITVSDAFDTFEYSKNLTITISVIAFLILCIVSILLVKKSSAIQNKGISLWEFILSSVVIAFMVCFILVIYSVIPSFHQYRDAAIHNISENIDMKNIAVKGHFFRKDGFITDIRLNVTHDDTVHDITMEYSEEHKMMVPQTLSDVNKLQILEDSSLDALLYDYYVSIGADPDAGSTSDDAPQHDEH